MLRFRVTLNKHVELLIAWCFLITDYLEGTLEIADSLLTQGNYHPRTIMRWKLCKEG